MTHVQVAGNEGHDREDQLIRMANDIADFFKPQGSSDDAIEGIASHMKRFWTRSMLAKLTANIENGAPELGELPRAALGRINQGLVNPVPHAGGDAG